MSQDTPYLLRMEMIKLAQDRASEKFQTEWSKALHNASVQQRELLTEVPTYPTADLLLEEAKKFKAFVDKG